MFQVKTNRNVIDVNLLQLTVHVCTFFEKYKVEWKYFWVKYFQSERFVEASRAQDVLIRGQTKLFHQLGQNYFALSDYNDTPSKYFLLYDDSPWQHSALMISSNSVWTRSRGSLNLPPHWECLCCDSPSSVSRCNASIVPFYVSINVWSKICKTQN